MRAPNVQQCTFVALTGGSGAGKSWLAGRLQAVLGADAARLALDDFYRDCSQLAPRQRRCLNFDSPEAIDWPELERTIRGARPGECLRVPRYDFRTHARLPHPGAWTARPVVLVDGLWLLQRPWLRRKFALRIFLDCPADVRLARRLARDVAGRGRTPSSVRHQFATQVSPMHARHVAPQAAWADLVLPGPDPQADACRLAAALWPLLPADSTVRRLGPGPFREALARALSPANAPPADPPPCLHRHEPLARHPATA